MLPTPLCRRRRAPLPAHDDWLTKRHRLPWRSSSSNSGRYVTYGVDFYSSQVEDAAMLTISLSLSFYVCVCVCVYVYCARLGAGYSKVVNENDTNSYGNERDTINFLREIRILYTSKSNPGLLCLCGSVRSTENTYPVFAIWQCSTYTTRYELQVTAAAQSHIFERVVPTGPTLCSSCWLV